MELRFWGVRGSLASPGPDTLIVGGNTTCVSVISDDYVLVFDAGTGIKGLGDYLEDEERSRWQGSIFLTHYHWDHIQGLPFFMPAIREENRFHLYGEEKRNHDLWEILSDQMQSPYFPVTMDDQAGLVTFNQIEPNQRIDIRPDVFVRTVRLNHPNGAIGYRMETPGGSICIITDHEHPEDGLDPAVVEFARDATILIHEAQYHPKEKSGPKAGWGHSSWEEAAMTAKQAAVGRLYLSHHDPSRSDREVFDILSRARQIFDQTEVATESTKVEVA